MPHARAAQASAPGQPPDAIRSRSESPTVGGRPDEGAGQLNRADHGRRIATSTKRGRSCGTSCSLAWICRHQVW